MRRIIIDQPHWHWSPRYAGDRRPNMTLVRGLVSCLVVLTVLVGQTFCVGLAVAQADTNADDGPHLYFFTSDGCAPCEIVKPSIAKLAAAGYPTSTINVRKRPNWARHFKISRTPTVVLVNQQQAVGRRAGMIRYEELLGWFETINYRPQTPSANALATQARPRPPQPPQPLAQPIGFKRGTDNAAGANTTGTLPFQSPTMHTGTSRAGNAAESRAMAATVKLQVEDPEGISYATGTVIHSHHNESLVLTCGHVFRDSDGTGTISAHYGFDQPSQRVGQGELIFYDADARDIALVVIHTEGKALPAVEVASRRTRVSKGDNAFSIGCDHGKAPTIRHTQIKNRASYDGAIKYDIYGRPVDGRSGGGLFTDDGRIIGVCNAAVIDVDEGIYTALDTIHWQLAKVKLDHLFDPDTALAMASPSPATTRRDGLARPDGRSPQQDFPLRQRRPVQPRQQPPARPATEQLELPPRPPTNNDFAGVRQPPTARPLPRQGKTTLVSLGDDAGTGARSSGSTLADYNREVLIIVRSKDDLVPAKTITIDNPSHQLVSYLEGLTPQQRTERAFDLARFREQARSGVRRPFQSSDLNRRETTRR